MERKTRRFNYPTLVEILQGRGEDQKGEKLRIGARPFSRIDWVCVRGWSRDDLLNEAEGLNGPVDVLTRKVMYLRPELFIALLGKCTSYNKTTGRVLALEPLSEHHRIATTAHATPPRHFQSMPNSVNDYDLPWAGRAPPLNPNGLLPTRTTRVVVRNMEVSACLWRVQRVV